MYKDEALYLPDKNAIETSAHQRLKPVPISFCDADYTGLKYNNINTFL